MRIAHAGFLSALQNAHLRVANRVGVIIHIHALDVGFAFFEIQMLHVVLLAAVDINGFFVHGGQRAGKIHFADHRRRAGNIDNHEIVAGDRAQADGIGGISFLRPVIIFAGAMQKARFGQPRAKFLHIHIAKAVFGSDRQFERRAFQMIDENFQIVRLDERVFRSIAKKIIGIAHDELIQRRGGSHQHRARTAAAATRAARALPCGRNGPGIAGHHHGVQRSNVDAQLQRAGGNHAANLPVAQPALDFPALVGQIAAAISANVRGPARAAADWPAANT